MITLRERDPIAAAEWYYPMNGNMTPDNMAGKSGKKAYFQCSNNPKHIYDRLIYDTIDKEGQHKVCLFCSGKRIFPGDNDLLTRCPEAVEMWDYDKNTIDPRTLHANSRSKVHFRCKNNHEFKREVKVFYRNPTCPECEFIKRSIVSAAPEVYDWWDYEKNVDDLPENHLKTDSKSVWWKCPKCGYGWKSEIATRAVAKFHCPCCDMGIAFKEGVNDALTRCQEIGFDWDYEANGELKPNKIFINDKNVKSEVYWACHICGYKWSTKSIGVRVYFEEGVAKLRKCPACLGKAADENTANITVTHPEIANEYIENLNIIPVTSIRYGSAKDRIWKCKKCKQIFVSSPAKRTRKGGAGGCPYCSGKLPIQGINDFATLHIDLLIEWDYKLNLIDPQNYTEFSSKKVNWVCQNDKTHKWLASPCERSSGNGRCPICYKIKKRYERMLIVTHPELLPYWDTELNEYPISDYSESSNRKAWWKCDNGHSLYMEIYHFSREGFHCSYCNEIKLLKGFNDLLTHYPEVGPIWYIEGNNGLRADEVIYSSGYYYNFICNIGHKWSRPIDKIVQYNFTCDYCEGRKLLPEFNSFGVRYKELASEWDYEKNDFSPFDVLPISNSYVFWVCNECSGKYRAMIKERVNGNYECPYCNDKRPNPGVNTLKAKYPRLATEYSYRNRTDSDNILSINKSQYIWICATCNTEWYATINERLSGTIPCPGCSGERAIPGKTSFKALYPELVKEYSKDNVFVPDEILPSYSISVDWHCLLCEMEWFSSVRDRVNGSKECPYCTGKKAIPGKTSFKALYPELVKEFALTNEQDSDLLLPTYSFDMKWNCSECDMEWEASIRDRVSGEVECPYCSGKKAIPGKTSFKAMHPELMNEFSLLNQNDPDLLLSSFAQVMKWNCSECDMEWEASIRDRVSGESECPYCTGRKAIPGKTSFKALYPELMKEYSPVNQNDPDTLTQTYSLTMKWNCSECDMEWEASIRDRVSGEAECPYCNGKKAIPGKTSFNALYPELMSEWKFISNLLLANPDLILQSSTKEVWWLCSHCKKSYSYKIIDKVNMHRRNKKSCPYCKGYRKTKRRYI
jgi:DNA-directed RNA polymerase subunit RPC12/RpoP